MTKHTSHLTRLAAPAATAAAALLGVSGIIRLTHEQSGESTTIGIEHLYLGGLTASLVLLVPVVLLLGRIAGRPRLARIAITGQLALAALTVISNVRGKDPSFFAAVAVPSNLLWLGGFVALAVVLRRSGRVPRAIAIGLPVAWVLTLPGSAVGGMVVAGAYWLVVGWLIAHDELVRRPGATAPARVVASEA
jgi:hypothetical protein